MSNTTRILAIEVVLGRWGCSTMDSDHSSSVGSLEKLPIEALSPDSPLEVLMELSLDSDDVDR
jgi:hypothetical protein